MNRIELASERIVCHPPAIWTHPKISNITSAASASAVLQKKK